MGKGQNAVCVWDMDLGCFSAFAQGCRSISIESHGFPKRRCHVISHVTLLID